MRSGSWERRNEPSRSSRVPSSRPGSSVWRRTTTISARPWTGSSPTTKPSSREGSPRRCRSFGTCTATSTRRAAGSSEALEAGSDEPSETRAKLLDGAGYLAFEQSDDQAVGLLEASLSCAKEVGATSTTAFAAAHLGGVLAYAGSGGSDAQAALAVGDEAVRLARKAGDDYVLAVALNNLGAIHDMLGDTERAAAYGEESLELRRRLGDMSGLALSLYNLADGALRNGDAGRAAALYSEAAAIAGAIGDKRHLCFAHLGLALVAHRERRWEDAETHARASLRLAKEIGVKMAMAEAVFCLAGTAAATGDPGRAARLAAAGELHYSRLTPEGMFLDDEVRASIETAKATSDPRIWQEAWTTGSAMSLDEAADYVQLGET